jgi:hypothetical protein
VLLLLRLVRLNRSGAIRVSRLTALEFAFGLFYYFDKLFCFRRKKILLHLLLSGVLHDGLRV